MAVELAAQQLILLAAGLDAIVADALRPSAFSSAACLASFLPGSCGTSFGSTGSPGRSTIADVDLVVDRLRRGVPAVGVVDDEQAAAGVRQQHRPAVEQAVGVVRPRSARSSGRRRAGGRRSASTSRDGC